MRIQFKYLTGIVLLSVVSGWLLVEIHNCSIFTSLSKNCTGPTSLSGQLTPESLHPLKQGEDIQHGYAERSGRNHYFLSRKEYDHYVDGILGLFLNAFGITSQSEMTVDETLDLLSSEEMLWEDLPPGLVAEHYDVQQLYREMLQEKKRWDYYQQVRYEGILVSRIEPALVNSRSLNLAEKDNLDYFLELENALKLHNRLVRDVRSFHDEVQYQKRQSNDDQSYQLYDLKLQLGPFARESAIADALQQALSTISAGIYQQEASQVIRRLVEEFTEPVRTLRQPMQDNGVADSNKNYNYQIYVVYGSKLLNYSKSLTEQSAVPLSASIFQELDYFNRQLIRSFYDLQEADLKQLDLMTQINLEELERDLF